MYIVIVIVLNSKIYLDCVIVDCWLSVTGQIKFKRIVLAYRVTSGSVPSYLNAVIQAYAPSHALRSSQERHLALPSPHTRQSQSRLFAFVVPRW